MGEILKIIDSHSHIGPSYLGPRSLPGTYVKEASRLGVVGAIVSPGPSPEVSRITTTYYPCLWRLQSGTPVYEQIIKSLDGETLSAEPSSPNPYHNANEQLFTLAERERKLRFLVMPLHHPILDTKEEVRAILFDHPSIGLKLHGIATYTRPSDVQNYTISLLRATGKPLVVHTDRHAGEITNPFANACQMNNSESWLAWANNTGVKIVLAHGARLTEPVIRAARSLPNVMIGMAPDLLIASDPARLATPTTDYLLTLMDMAGPENVLFDIDYGWNVRERDKWDTQDWDMRARVEAAAATLGMSDENVHDILFQNAVSFFQL